MELISREDAIKCFDMTIKVHSLESAEIFGGYIKTTISRIKALPTIEERKEGEWLHAEIIDDDKDFGVNSDATQCSICGDYQESYYWAKTYYHYCPNCGARMKG